MKYMGSKNRIAKNLLPIMLKNRTEGQWWVEPFVGGANMIDKVNGNRIGSDSNKYLIASLVKLQQGWLPEKSISEETYINVKENINMYEDFFVGYIGFQLSFGAMWFSTFRRDKAGVRDYSLEAYRNVKKQAKKIKGVIFSHNRYEEVVIPNKSIIYCDPPYRGTAGYKENNSCLNY
ncbi:MAG: DNA adenine methylase, partial [Flavobacteriaceae bacterium]|nr:DNA adenine methylase [Flavobacteriaceae bacterium]